MDDLFIPVVDGDLDERGEGADPIEWIDVVRCGRGAGRLPATHMFRRYCRESELEDSCSFG